MSDDFPLIECLMSFLFYYKLIANSLPEMRLIKSKLALLSQKSGIR